MKNNDQNSASVIIKAQKPSGKWILAFLAMSVFFLLVGIGMFKDSLYFKGVLSAFCGFIFIILTFFILLIKSSSVEFSKDSISINSRKSKKNLLIPWSEIDKVGWQSFVEYADPMPIYGGELYLAVTFKNKNKYINEPVFKDKAIFSARSIKPTDETLKNFKEADYYIRWSTMLSGVPEEERRNLENRLPEIVPITLEKYPTLVSKYKTISLVDELSEPSQKRWQEGSEEPEPPFKWKDVPRAFIRLLRIPLILTFFLIWLSNKNIVPPLNISNDAFIIIEWVIIFPIISFIQLFIPSRRAKEHHSAYFLGMMLTAVTCLSILCIYAILTTPKDEISCHFPMVLANLIKNEWEDKDNLMVRVVSQNEPKSEYESDILWKRKSSEPYLVYQGNTCTKMYFKNHSLEEVNQFFVNKINEKITKESGFIKGELNSVNSEDKSKSYLGDFSPRGYMYSYGFKNLTPKYSYQDNSESYLIKIFETSLSEIDGNFKEHKYVVVAYLICGREKDNQYLEDLYNQLLSQPTMIREEERNDFSVFKIENIYHPQVLKTAIVYPDKDSQKIREVYYINKSNQWINSYETTDSFWRFGRDSHYLDIPPCSKLILEEVSSNSTLRCYDILSNTERFIDKNLHSSSRHYKDIESHIEFDYPEDWYTSSFFVAHINNFPDSCSKCSLLEKHNYFEFNIGVTDELDESRNYTSAKEWVLGEENLFEKEEGQRITEGFMPSAPGFTKKFIRDASDIFQNKDFSAAEVTPYHYSPDDYTRDVNSTEKSYLTKKEYVLLVGKKVFTVNLIYPSGVSLTSSDNPLSKIIQSLKIK